MRSHRTEPVTCASNRTLVVDGRGARDVCRRAGVEQMTPQEMARELRICRAEAIRCRPMEAYVYGRCLGGLIAEQPGRDNCMLALRPNDGTNGQAPLPRGDGSRDRVLAHAADGTTPRWFGLLDADTLFGFVRAGGTSTHTLVEYWRDRAQPVCMRDVASGVATLCNDAVSPDFAASAVGVGDGFP